LDEFVQLLDLLLTQPVTTWHGEWFAGTTPAQSSSSGNPAAAHH